MMEDREVVARLVRHLYKDLGQASGGPLHIVVDDMNVDDHWMRATYDHLFDGRFEQWAEAGDDTSDTFKLELVRTCELILAGLRRMTVDERREAIRAAWRELESWE
jgi:hypothetical protein